MRVTRSDIGGDCNCIEFFLVHGKTLPHRVGILDQAAANSTNRSSASAIVALFLALLVTYRGLLGELPNELSGRGVRYADRDAVDQLRSELSDAIARLQENQEDLRNAVAQIIDDPGDDSQSNG